MTKLRPLTQLQKNVFLYAWEDLYNNERKAVKRMVNFGLAKGVSSSTFPLRFVPTALGQKRLKLG